MTETLPQGDLRLLDTDLARELLASDVYARVAYVARDGTPRVTPTWFQWNGEELVMPTFLQAPHVGGPARRLVDLAANPTVAVTIDTEDRPPKVLQLRGQVEVTEVDGLDPDYATSARQYLGEDAASGYLAMLAQGPTRMARIVVRPTWVSLLDFETRAPGIMPSP